LFARLLCSIGRLCCLAAVLGPLSGCAMSDFHKWNFDRYRDERARDIDERLSEDRPIVQNPF
jgi:hypothetical protein